MAALYHEAKAGTIPADWAAELAHEFSQGPEYNADELDTKWNSGHLDTESAPVRFGSLIDAARRSGWTDPLRVVQMLSPVTMQVLAAQAEPIWNEQKSVSLMDFEVGSDRELSSILATLPTAERLRFDPTQGGDMHAAKSGWCHYAAESGVWELSTKAWSNQLAAEAKAFLNADNLHRLNAFKAELLAKGKSQDETEAKADKFAERLRKRLAAVDDRQKWGRALAFMVKCRDMQLVGEWGALQGVIVAQDGALRVTLDRQKEVARLELLPHSPEFKATGAAPVRWADVALPVTVSADEDLGSWEHVGETYGCPWFVRIVRHLCMTNGRPNHQVERYVLSDIGSALLGYKCEQSALMFIGASGSGKSTLCSQLLPILEGGLVAAISMEDIWGKRDRDDAKLAALHGMRLIIVSECSGTGSTQAFKETTGDDPLSPRVPYAIKPLQMTVGGRFVCAGNSTPQFYNDGSEAVERRMRVVRVEGKVQIPLQREALTAELVSERPGIIGLLVHVGAAHAARLGSPDVPKSILAAARRARHAVDIVQEFLDTKCRLGVAGAAIEATAFGTAVVNYGILQGTWRNGNDPGARKIVHIMTDQKGYPAVKSSAHGGRNVFRGISVIT